MKCYVISLGCAKNLVDSENICGLLRNGGVEFVNRASSADIILINTCGFIESAKKEAIDTILDMASYKQKKCKKLIVTGCFVQRYCQELKKELPEVDVFIPIKDYKNLPTILHEQLGITINATYGKNCRVQSNNPWMSYLKIGDGCSNRCSYCAIPLIRGDWTSFDMDDIVSNAIDLASKGVKELVLIAQDTTMYGIDLPGHKLLLPKLLTRLNAIQGLVWIRILYMYPDEITDELLDTMKSCEKVLPYFDIPLQHVNDRMLKIMNRRGSKQLCYDIVEKIRNKFEHPVLRTTMICGFPSETEEEFAEMLEFVKNVGWDHLGGFTFSDEEDTKAHYMADKIDEEVMESRLKRLMDLQNEIYHEKANKMIGTTLDVLVEKQDSITKLYYGRSYFNAPDGVDGEVIFKADKEVELGSFVKVRIKKVANYNFIADLVK